MVNTPMTYMYQKSKDLPVRILDLNPVQLVEEYFKLLDIARRSVMEVEKSAMFAGQRELFDYLTDHPDDLLR